MSRAKRPSLEVVPGWAANPQKTRSTAMYTGTVTRASGEPEDVATREIAAVLAAVYSLKDGDTLTVSRDDRPERANMSPMI